MKKIKNKIARTIINFGKLFVFACLLLPCFAICCLLGSWTYNSNNDTITSDNLFDKSTTTDGYYIYYVNGRANVESNYCYEYISCIPNENYSFSGLTSENVHVAFFNGSSFLSGVLSSGLITTPSSCSRFSFSIKITDKNTAMLNKGSSPLPYEPYGASYINQEQFDSLQENYYTLEDDYDTLQGRYDNLESEYDNLQQEYDSLEDQANQWYLDKRYYEDAYNQLANTIDNDIYSIDLVHYNSSDTLYDNYNVVYTFDDISPFIVSNSYLDFNAIKRAIPSLNPPIDLSQVNGIIINSTIDLSIAQYNLLFNAISSPEYYIGLYYSTKSTSNQFASYPLRIITDNGATYYFNSYSLYDVLKTQGFDNLFSDFTYNKLAIHLTNNNFQYFTINNIKLNSENGYNTGYSKGLLDSANTIASLQNNVNDLEYQKIALNDRIDTLQRQLNNNLGWHSLFFSMADTPIKVVSGFLDYEILGINLFKALLGILTALAVLWLIKRFTK